MNFSDKGLGENRDAKINSLNKVTTLNPNAAEFVPSALKSTYGSTKISIPTSPDVPGSSKKAILDLAETTTSNISDDEIHQNWWRQLPDDITPDFKVMGEEELNEPDDLPLASLSIHDNAEPLKFSAPRASQIFDVRQGNSAVTSLNLNTKMGCSGPFADKQSSTAFMTLAVNSWGNPFTNGEQHSTNGREGHQYDGDSSAGLMNDLIGDSANPETAAINPIELLTYQFPGFAAQSLADIYYGNGCDLNLTIEILTQLELQLDGSFTQNYKPQPVAAPSLSLLDFPALPVSGSPNGLPKYSGEDAKHASNTYRSPSSILRGGTDFASTVKKLASQDSGHWKYERPNAADGAGVSSSRKSQFLAGSYNGNGKMVYGDKLQSSGGARTAPIWLETGEAVGHMYSESREEARDLARLRNACFEQARQAYLIGNKALAKDLSLKGQFYNLQMKAAHEKAREAIYKQRNPHSSEAHGYSRGQDRLIDLHGLHVSEAVHVLNQELTILRSTARSTGQRLQVMICVRTGHHTKGARTPARLPVAIEQYLLEEGLHFTQPQPGLLRVVIY